MASSPKQQLRAERVAYAALGGNVIVPSHGSTAQDALRQMALLLSHKRPSCSWIVFEESAPVAERPSARSIDALLERGDLEKTLHIHQQRELLAARRRVELLEARNDEQLACIGELAKQNRTLLGMLIDKDRGGLRIHEMYTGRVTRVIGDEVLVAYDAEGGRLEQVYDRSQFKSQVLPNEGDEVHAYVLVTIRPCSHGSPPPTSTEEGDEDDFRGFRDEGIKGPIRV